MIPDMFATEKSCHRPRESCDGPGCRDAKALARDLGAAQAREAGLREALVRHNCPFGDGVLWCSEHQRYHKSDIDAALAEPTTG